MKKVAIIISFFAIYSVNIFAQNLMNITIDNYSISVPEGWSAQYTNSQPVFILLAPLEENDTFQENANSTIEKLFDKMTTSEYLQATRDILSKIYDDFELISIGTDYHVISGILNGIAVTQLQYVAIKNGTAYIMTYSSDPDSFMQYLDTFLLIHNTFKY